MSHFYGSMQGGRGRATRCGTKSSGMTAHIRGWDIGVRVEITHENVCGHMCDMIRVYKTDGSNGHGQDVLIAEYGKYPNGYPIIRD